MNSVGHVRRKLKVDSVFLYKLQDGLCRAFGRR